MDVLQIRLLGKVEVWRENKHMALPGRKTQALLVYLTAQNRAHSHRDLYDQFCAMRRTLLPR